MLPHSFISGSSLDAKILNIPILHIFLLIYNVYISLSIYMYIIIDIKQHGFLFTIVLFAVSLVHVPLSEERSLLLIKLINQIFTSGLCF